MWCPAIGRVTVYTTARAQTIVYPRILNKMVKSMACLGFLSLNDPPKVPTYEDSTYQKGFSLIDACLYRANLFLRSFTVHALLLSENKEKNVFHGFENSISHFLLP